MSDVFFDDDQIKTFRIDAYEKQAIPRNTRIAFLSGSVPRLIVQEGPEVWEIYESQCLPVGGYTNWIMNPFHFPITVTIGFGMPVNYGPIPDTSSIASRWSYETLSTYGYSAAAHATMRNGLGVMCKKGRATVFFSAQTQAATRVTVIDGASPAFFAQKPGGIMTRPELPMRLNLMADTNLITVGGTFLDTDMTAWIAAATAAGFAGSVRQFNYEAFSTNYRYTIDDDTAIFFSRAETVAMFGNMFVNHLGGKTEGLI